jgi:Electron transfer DM13
VKRHVGLLACLVAVSACASSTAPGMSSGNGGGGGTDSLAYAGTFHTLSGPGQGMAQVYDLAGGGRQLRFTSSFSTEINPNVEVWLVAAPDVHSDSTVLHSPYVSLGPLQSATGAQTYAVPDTVDFGTFQSVTVWCVKAQVVFVTAPLAPQ